MGRKSIVASGPLLVSYEDRENIPMYKQLYKELLDICSNHGSILDLTNPKTVIVMKTTARCRKDIRHLYGRFVQKSRYADTIELGGFT